jgi:hypothetical protein
MTKSITITYNEADESVLMGVIKKIKAKTWAIVPPNDGDDALRTAAIRERLRLKYVTTGEWKTMDDEDRQDASLLEGMLYDRENGQIETHSEADSLQFYRQLKRELHEI